jgi:hypothetical protein
MHKMFYLKISILLVLCTVLFILIGNSNSDDQLPDWRKGELVVILPLAESIDYQFNRQLAESFASFLGVRLKILEMNPYQVSTTLTEHLAHFSAIGMRSNEDNALLRFGPPYQAVNEALICKNMQPQKLEDVIGRSIVVIKDSAEDAARLALHPLQL